jgi:Tat protein secretion system quality control protein TatD with DNase activity
MSLRENESVYLIDTHAHSDAFSVPEWRQIVERALVQGVSGNLSAGVWWDQFDHLLAEFSDWILPRPANREKSLEFIGSSGYHIFPALGLHPMEIASRWRSVDGRFDTSRAETDAEKFFVRARKHRDVIWAVGETGFDASTSVVAGWCGKEELLDAQTFAFRNCVRLAVEFGLPLIIHSRSAWKKTQDAVDEALAQGVKTFMIHCYGGPPSDLLWIERRRGFASFGGVITRPDAHRVRQGITVCPADVLLFETDSPDLPPILADGHRPLKNEPQFLCDVIDCAAFLRQQSAVELRALNFKNFMRFLGF